MLGLNRYIAYADVNCKPKQDVLVQRGFKQTTIYKDCVAKTWVRSTFADVALFEKTTRYLS
jgi:hypothetical protein